MVRQRSFRHVAREAKRTPGLAWPGRVDGARAEERAHRPANAWGVPDR